MKKVLLVGPCQSVGGISKYITDLLNSQLKYKIIHFNTARPIKHTTSIADVGYRAIFDAGFGRFLLAIFITIKHLLSFPLIMIFRQPDIVHITGVSFSGFWENAYYIVISKFFHKPVLLHYLGAFDIFYDLSNKFEKYFIKYILRKVDKISVLSKKAKSIMNQFMKEELITIIPTWVDISFFRKKTDVLFPDDKMINLLFVGGADPLRKGLRDIIRTIPIVTNKVNNVRYIFTGSLTVKKVLSEYRIKNIHKHVIFLSWVSENEKVKLYNSADILLLPSYNEGLPYVIIEAMAARLPVIASTVGAIPEIIEEGVNGYLIAPGDYNELAQKILLLIKDRKQREKIGIRNYMKVRTQYQREIIIKKIEDLYDNLA